MCWLDVSVLFALALHPYFTSVKVEGRPQRINTASVPEITGSCICSLPSDPCFQLISAKRNDAWLQYTSSSGRPLTFSHKVSLPEGLRHSIPA